MLAWMGSFSLVRPAPVKDKEESFPPGSCALAFSQTVGFCTGNKLAMVTTVAQEKEGNELAAIKFLAL